MSYSCKKEEFSLVLPDEITPGQKYGSGIDYVDFEPDLNCSIIDPWNKQDTNINLDLNRDGIYDFTLKRVMCHPVFLGGDCDDVTIIPLMNNEICVRSELGWLDTLSIQDTIDSRITWTNKEGLIYSYNFVLGGISSTEGFWFNILSMDDKYLGFKIIKDDKKYFGWMGMYADSVNRSIDFIVTDYAILKEYPE